MKNCHKLRLVLVSLSAVSLGTMFAACAYNQQTSESKERSIILAQVSNLAQSHSFNKAKELLSPLLKKFPQDAEVHLTAARLFRQMGAYNQSIQEYEQTQCLAPNLSEPLIGLSQMHLKNLNTKAALECARKAVRVAPASTESNLALISALMASGYIGDANLHLMSLLKNNPNDSQVQYMAYKLNKERGQFSLARRYLDDAVRLNPKQIDWLIDLSELYQVDGEYNNSRRCLEYVVNHNPSNVDALNKLAILLEFFFHDYDGAIKRYHTILSIDPDSIEALAGLDRCKVKNNDLAALWKYQIRNFMTKLVNGLYQR